LGLDGRSIGILHHQAASGGDVFHLCSSKKQKLVFKTSSAARRDVFQMPQLHKAVDVSCKAMTTFSTYKFIALLTLSLLTRLAVSACSCMDSPTTEQAYKRSDLVILGRIIGTDTIQSSNMIMFDRKGIKVGRHRYSVYSEIFLRVKMVVEKSFKLVSDIPDTIYVLTKLEGAACGYPFLPFFKEVSPERYQYIIYGTSWIEKTITKTKKGKRNIGQIKELKLNDTFFTNTCSRTQFSNKEELRNLSTLIE
jgi:hypothetical protein